MNDYDGWHTVCGYEVYIKDGMIHEGMIRSGDSKVPAYVYRAVRSGGWQKEDEVTVSAFRNGARRGTIRLKEDA